MTAAALRGTRFAHGLHHIASTGSTNALALAAAMAGTSSGVWVADEQTAGRGRGGHTWHSAPGDGLYVSVLATPKLSAAGALPISLAAGIAAQDAIRQAANVQIDLRWPNDLMLGGRKCGGILVETAAGPVQTGAPPARLRYAVIGVGLNLAHATFPPELAATATSLRLETGRAVTRDAVLAPLLRALDHELTELERGEDTEPWADAARVPSRAISLLERFALCSTWVRGKRVVVDDRYTGVTDGLTAEGFLRIAADDGSLHVVRSGGVRELASSQPGAQTSAQ